MEQAHDNDLKLAEAYFLGELTDAEAEAFEAHYFECARCAEYVREELVMFESGRTVAEILPDSPAKVVPISEGRRRRGWIPLAAAAMLVLAVGTPMLLQGRSAPMVDVVAPEPIRFSADRAAAAPAKVFPANAPFALDIGIPPVDAAGGAPVARYSLTVRNQASEVVGKRQDLTADQAAEPVLLVLNALPAGTYKVAIEGVREDGNRSTITTYPFEVRK
jgi:hypothetical protein